MSNLSSWRRRLKRRLKLRHAARVLLLRRRRQVSRARKHIARIKAAPGAAAAVRWALSLAGKVHEQPAYSNWGPRISDWIKATGYGGPEPWCQCFANAVAEHGGAPQLHTGYTPTVLAGIDGYRKVALHDAEQGDMIFFKFPGVSSASCDHVGILVHKTPSTVECVEGNTSGGNVGSQNDGGGVYLRTRSVSLVAGAVRPPYPRR